VLTFASSVLGLIISNRPAIAACPTDIRTDRASPEIRAVLEASPEMWTVRKASPEMWTGREASPEMRTVHGSICSLPYEIVEMIIAHLAGDFASLKACSLTCRSWYTVAVLHIHHTLILRDKLFDTDRCELQPLSKLHELNLFPLVKEIRVEQRHPWFVPGVFTPSDLHYFSIFPNVHTLRIEKLDVRSFIPGIERYFEAFPPTLRSILLSEPVCGVPQHLSYFLSLFPNLDDVDIQQPHCAPTSNTELVPFSTPKLQGKLKLYQCRSTETWKHLISVFGGLRFRYMSLRQVGASAPILLAACGKTLETLRFYVPEPPG
jgi:hypothetical protein